MASTWSLLKKVGSKKFDELSESFERTGPRIDANLPLGLRIKGIVETPQVDFILAGDALKVKYPGPGNIVLSYGVFPMGKSMFHRFYLGASDEVYMLQIITDEQKNPQDCKLFMPYDEVFPDDWDFWLSERDGYIGYNTFQLQDGTQYFRVWDDPEREIVLEQDDQGNKITRVPPWEFLETVYLDPWGKQSEMVKHECMLYARAVNDQVNEFLLVSAAQDNDGASVQIMTGIALEPVSLKVI
jgi:hypothetical protein